jgi:low affinity Fe/Cu permease
MARQRTAIAAAFERMAWKVTRFTGSTAAFVTAAGVVLVWLATGPFFRFSNTWQLIINTGTTVATFLMVFVIQRTQNKEALATQLKLNEIVAALEGASNRLVSVEDLSEEELEVLHAHYRQLADMAAEATHLRESHSIEEAEGRHLAKAIRRRKGPSGSRTS